VSVDVRRHEHLLVRVRPQLRARVDRGRRFVAARDGQFGCRALVGVAFEARADLLRDADGGDRRGPVVIADFPGGGNCPGT
jgi:hypothetical protein